MNRVCLVAGAALLLAGSAQAADGVPTHDPFRRPDLLAAPAAAPEVALAWRPQLRGVLLAGPRSLANVAGAIVRIGEEIEGYRLVRVDEGRAWFSKGGREVMLKLEHLPEITP